MHELAIAESVVDAVLSKADGMRIRIVRLEIGKLAGVQVDSLRFCFELATVDTELDGARLDIAEPAGLAKCASCALEFSTDDLILLCPCGSADVRLLTGDELRILSVSMEASR